MRETSGKSKSRSVTGETIIRLEEVIVILLLIASVVSIVTRRLQALLEGDVDAASMDENLSWPQMPQNEQSS